MFGYGRWSEAVIFSTLMLVLIFKPIGLLGQQTGSGHDAPGRRVRPRRPDRPHRRSLGPMSPMLFLGFLPHQSLTIILGRSPVGSPCHRVVASCTARNGFGTAERLGRRVRRRRRVRPARLGLNVVVGLAGLLDLGYAAFFAIGAYTYAYGASPIWGLHIPFWIMLLVGAMVAALFGLLLGAPTLRLRGDYLAIVTLGFGEIVPVVILNADTYTNGTNGITGLAQPDPYGLLGVHGFGFTNPWAYFITAIVIIAVAFIFLYRLQNSRIGRAWSPFARTSWRPPAWASTR